MRSGLRSATRRSQRSRSVLIAVELALEVGDPLVEGLLRQQAVVAGIGVDAEIADEQRGQDIEAERSQERRDPRANDHVRCLTRAR